METVTPIKDIESFIKTVQLFLEDEYEINNVEACIFRLLIWLTEATGKIVHAHIKWIA
jgi:hypothetical protein